MSSSKDVKFSLHNENTVATFGADLGSDAEKDFGDLVCGGYIGNMATDVRVRALGEEMAATGINPETGLTGKRSLSVLMIPHTFSLRPADNDLLRKKIDSVGLLIEFQPGDHPFSLEELLPNSSFAKVFEARLSGSVKIGYKWTEGLFGLPEIFEPSSGDGQDNSVFQFHLNFGYAFHAANVSATGRGRRLASFELFSDRDAPLYNRDITVWTVVLYNSYASKLDYRAKFFYTSRRFTSLAHCETDWMPYSVPVPRD